MSDKRSEESLRIDKLSLNLDYSFNKGVDLDNRVIRLTEDIEEHHFDWFDSALTALETLNRKSIILRINSFGGDTYTALSIIGRMQESKCLINTRGYGKIMSASTAILAAGHKRSMSRLAQFMHHEASYGVEGRHSQVTNEVKVVQRQEEDWAKLMFELTGIASNYWLTRGVGTDYHLNAQQCLSLNIIDEVF